MSPKKQTPPTPVSGTTGHGLTKVSDAGLKHLCGLSELDLLDLDDTDVSDNGVKLLVGLTDFQELHLFNTKVSPEGIKQPKQAMPHCSISNYGPDYCTLLRRRLIKHD